MASGSRILRRRRTTWTAVYATVWLASACTGPGTGPGPASPLEDPALPVDRPPQTAVVRTDDPGRPGDHEVPEPDPPAGSPPSFNESPGCGGPDGIRGPYADAEGIVPDTQMVNGPWGDFFGRDMAEVRHRLVAVELPNAEGEQPVTVYVHERVAPALEMVIENLVREQEAGRSYRLEPGSVFSFRPATVPPKRYLSFHAVGAAIDINATTNPYREDNLLITDMPDWFVQAWTDAGWCWGGSWEKIKDPMHFSWKGPRHTPGYELPESIPRRTGAGSFDRSLTLETALGRAPDSSIQLIADLDRDGAPDAVRIAPWSATDRLGVETAQAIHGFDTCRTAGPTPHPREPGATLLLADRTGDDRPDLWVLDPSEDRISVTVFTFASGYTEHVPIVEAARRTSPAAVFLVGDHDLDGTTDLYTIEPGDPTLIELRAGPGFGDVILQAAPPLSAGPGWRFALGRRDADRVPDLFALGPGDPATLSILAGGDGFRGPAETANGIPRHGGALQTGDLDGDGWDDLYFFDPDGTITVYLGGDRAGTPDADLVSWFLEGGDQPWEYRAGCPPDPGAPR